MNENKVKTPMSKAKKDFISAIIIIVSGAIFIVAGIISLTVPKVDAWNIALGVIFTVCGAAMSTCGGYTLGKTKPIYDKEKGSKQI